MRVSQFAICIIIKFQKIKLNYYYGMHRSTFSKASHSQTFCMHSRPSVIERGKGREGERGKVEGEGRRRGGEWRGGGRQITGKNYERININLWKVVSFSDTHPIMMLEEGGRGRGWRREGGEGEGGWRRGGEGWEGRGREGRRAERSNFEGGESGQN